MKDVTFVMLNWEQDWDVPTSYFNVTEDGKIIKYDILTDTLYEYELSKVVQ